VADQPTLPGPIPYELRIGVTGHRELDRPDEVDRAVRALIRELVAVLEGAAANPLGPHGSHRSRIERFDLALAECLAASVRVAGPALDLFARVLAAPLRAISGVRPPARIWPRVPVSPRRPDEAHRTGLKLTVISALASGADQIVARAVCDLVRQPELRNRYLEAVLPFQPEVYEEDFTDPRDLAEFRALLKLDRGRLDTHSTPTVLIPEVPAHPDASDAALRRLREEAYAAAGRYVVNTSEMIVAVWDPTREDKPGGTGVTVRYAVERGRVVLWLNPAKLEAGPVLLHAGNRLVAADAAGRHGAVAGVLARLASWRRTFGPASRSAGQGADASLPGAPAGFRVERVPRGAKQLSVHFHRLAAYNRDGAVDEARLQRELEDRAAALSATARACSLPPGVTDSVVGVLLPHVMRADHLACRYRELRDFSAQLWPTAAAFVVTLMAFQIVFLPDHYWLAFVELAVVVLGYVSYRVSLHEAWHEKWLNDRRLAEGLRTALFTTLVRSERDDEALAREFSIDGTRARIQDPLPFYSPANAWFVASMKRVLAKERKRFAHHLDLQHGDHLRAVARFLREGWVLEQADYHAKHAAEGLRLVEWSKRVRLAAILAIALVAALHGLGVGHDADPATTPMGRVDLWLAFATVALPAWAAAFHVMLSLDDHERLSERSMQMTPLLQGLADQLDRVASVAGLRDCVSEAGRVMDLESAEWAESLVDRKPEFTG
jgi:hypothetical protein